MCDEQNEATEGSESDTNALLYCLRCKQLKDALEYIDGYLEDVTGLVSDGHTFSAKNLKKDIKQYLAI